MWVGKAEIITAYGAGRPPHSLLSPCSLTNEDSKVSLKCCSSALMLPVRTPHIHPLQS